MGSGDRQRGGGRDEEQSSDESTREAGGDLTRRSERCEHFETPLHFLWTRPSGPCQIQCTGRANSKMLLFFSAPTQHVVKIAGKQRFLLVKSTNLSWTAQPNHCPEMDRRYKCSPIMVSSTSCRRRRGAGPAPSCSSSLRRRGTGRRERPRWAGPAGPSASSCRTRALSLGPFLRMG